MGGINRKLEDFRLRIWDLLEPARVGDLPSRVLDFALITLIMLAVIEMILGSVPEFRKAAPIAFEVSETVILSIFALEYAVRVWACIADDRFRGRFEGRFRFALSFSAVIDLLAILPLLAQIPGLDLRVLRLIRIFRIVRILKLTRYSSAIDLISTVIRQQRDPLVVSISFFGALLLIASTLMYFAEREAQPELFGSIPESMWWAVVTLTTVGYGDVFPVTPFGRVLAAAIALVGIAVVAVPTGILGAGFVEEMERRARANEPSEESAS
ncbi:MAG: ion transporter [Planctomycetota bacterium]